MNKLVVGEYPINPDTRIIANGGTWDWRVGDGSPVCCPHAESGSVIFNRFNRVLKCQACGRVWLPAFEMEAFEPVKGTSKP